MTKFIQTVDGLHVLPKEISSLQKCADNKTVIKTRDGKRHAVEGMLLEDLKSIIDDERAKIIPAAPGYSVAFLLWPTRKSKKWRTVVFPVVGWRLAESSCDVGQIYESVPVIAGVHDISTVWAIVLPDGKLLSPWSDLPVSMSDWIYDAKIAADAESMDLPGVHGEENENGAAEID
jgi:hypothetical protein